MLCHTIDSNPLLMGRDGGGAMIMPGVLKWSEGLNGKDEHCVVSPIDISNPFHTNTCLF